MLSVRRQRHGFAYAILSYIHIGLRSAHTHGTLAYAWTFVMAVVYYVFDKRADVDAWGPIIFFVNVFHSVADFKRRTFYNR